ncbi:hypothetical protein BDA96_01G070600 [Sorghum bicolor]|uniref:Uncharacterized protein n=2 Tax=Sorghum bicolor TaxID=4558 RepID=A0A921RVK2_SORBI|nr:hypothetical protein BDA96_01G070600 [Sorghum bicolor]KXG37430.1 hypothetical protein SORBI_3001G068200 [Sorghum bicolor]
MALAPPAPPTPLSHRSRRKHGGEVQAIMKVSIGQIRSRGHCGGEQLVDLAPPPLSVASLISENGAVRPPYLLSS